MASATFSAVIMVGKFVLAHGTTGKIEASHTRSPSRPYTRPAGLVTAIGSVGAPIRHVHEACQTPNAAPVCVLSHIPILSSAAYFDGERVNGSNWVVPGAWMHIDAKRIKDLFCRHPNVKVCLSGHLHMVDDVTYLGVRYLCNGAVCGGWWKGNYQQFGPAYAVLDLYEDGHVERQLMDYAAPRPAK